MHPRAQVKCNADFAAIVAIKPFYAVLLKSGQRPTVLKSDLAPTPTPTSTPTLTYR